MHLKSIVKCPQCDFEKEETMPIDTWLPLDIL